MTAILIDNKYEITSYNANDSFMGMTIVEIYDKIRQFLDNKKNFENHDNSMNGYTVGVSDADDMICFHFDDPFWSIYYSERGRRINPSFFTHWMDAADFFVREVLGRKKYPRIIDWSDECWPTHNH